MKHGQPRGLSRRRVGQLLSKTNHDSCTGGRIAILSRLFLGCPYESNPLIGSVGAAEVFTASLEGFDCVTYIETILALSRASTVDSFIKWLRMIRYDGGCINWERRNHYMTCWIRNNIRNGIIKAVVVPGIPIVSRRRVLNVVRGLPSQRASVKFMSKRAATRLAAFLRSGDLIFFVSTRENLDVFHAGIIVRVGDRILMRHASRSHGLVIEQVLAEFLKANRMSGVIVMRPQDAAERRAES